MSQLTLALIALFGSLALLAGMATQSVLAPQAPAPRLLLGPDRPLAPTGVLAENQRLSDLPTAQEKKLAEWVPKSPKEMGRLQRRLATAGFYGFKSALIYSFAEIMACE